jgi:hypothetical protein
VVTTLCLLPMHRGCGCSGHPAFPAPSISEGRTVHANPGRIAPRDANARLEFQQRQCTPSFRGVSEANEPGIHNHDREYGFSDVQLHIKARAKEGASRNDGGRGSWLAMTARAV